MAIAEAAERGARVIEGKNLRLVQFTEDHITPRYLGWLNNRELTQHMRHSNAVHTVQSALTYYDSIPRGDLFYAIEHHEHGHIGNIGASCDTLNSRADMSILLGEHPGRGYALEAWSLLMDALLKQFHKATAGTVVDNKAMIKLAWRSGMVEDGYRRRHDMRNGVMVDVVQFARWA